MESKNLGRIIGHARKVGHMYVHYNQGLEKWKSSLSPSIDGWVLDFVIRDKVIPISTEAMHCVAYLSLR